MGAALVPPFLFAELAAQAIQIIVAIAGIPADK
jgi:hypothetical protein